MQAAPASNFDRFTRGDCHILAEAIHDVTGWPICTFVSSWSGSAATHAFVEHPSGDYVDIEGRTPAAEFIDRWKVRAEAMRLHVRHWPNLCAMELAGWWTPPRWDDSPDIARDIAGSIIEAAD